MARNSPTLVNDRTTTQEEQVARGSGNGSRSGKSRATAARGKSGLVTSLRSLAGKSSAASASNSEECERVSSAVKGLDAVVERLGLAWLEADEQAAIAAAPMAPPVALDAEDEWLRFDPLPSRDPRVAAAISLLAARAAELGDSYVSELTDELVVFPLRGRKRQPDQVVTVEDWEAFLRIWSRLPVRTAVDFAGWWKKRLAGRLPSARRARGGSHPGPGIAPAYVAALYSGAVD
jgi:hypothetical protein